MGLMKNGIDILLWLGWGWIPTAMALCLFLSIFASYFGATANGHIDGIVWYIEYEAFNLSNYTIANILCSLDTVEFTSVNTFLAFYTYITGQILKLQKNELVNYDCYDSFIFIFIFIFYFPY